MGAVRDSNVGSENGRVRPATPAARTSYRIDPATSRVEFTIGKRLFFVKHLLVTGRFADVQGAISLDEHEPANTQAEVTIGAASVNTGMGKRDRHLREADFFDVERYPHMTFVSRRIETLNQASGRYRVAGDLTVRGVTRGVTLDATYAPADATYFPTRGAGPRRITLTLTGGLNRRDFGLVWNNPLISIPDDLTVKLQIEATLALLSDTVYRAGGAAGAA
jgi:polyisoprenoid-binding protein YceI